MPLDGVREKHALFKYLVIEIPGGISVGQALLCMLGAADEVDYVLGILSNVVCMFL
jgi:hypothetical protein